MNQFIYLILLSIAEIFGDFTLEKYANTGKLPFLGYGTIGYVGVIYFLIKSLKGSSILFVNAAWDGISALIETIAAMVILKERFSNSYQYLGIGLIIAGLFFLKSGNKESFKNKALL